MKILLSMAAAVSLAALAAAGFAQAEGDATVIPAPAVDEQPASDSETAVLSGGCFWGMQGVFEHVKGVKRVLSGYAGGAADAAHYGDVSDGDTGHAETVQITYDPHVVTYGQLLRVYFSVAHDPTELNRQGPDEGTQYRSDIWYTNAEQQKIAAAYIAQLTKAHVYAAPIVTRVDAFKGFYPAEAYHQDFLIKNPDYPYIVINDLPKIAALKRLYPALYAEKPVRVADAK